MPLPKLARIFAVIWGKIFATDRADADRNADSVGA